MAFQADQKLVITSILFSETFTGFEIYMRPFGPQFSPIIKELINIIRSTYC